jgi:uncharacterized protein YjbJ (UPF0337 family)
MVGLSRTDHLRKLAVYPDCFPGDPIFPLQETQMNWDRVEGNWKKVKGKVKEQWGRLTDDHLDVVAGKRDQLVGRIQESYGIARDEAERQVSDWEDRNRDLFEDRSKV